MKTPRLAVVALALVSAIVLSACKDEETPVPILPVVTTTPVQDVQLNSAAGGGNVESDGGSEVSARGLCWSTATLPSIDNSHSIDGEGEGPFVSVMINLTPSTTYYIRAYASNEAGTAYGNELTFTTARPKKIFNGDVALETQQQIDDFGAEDYNVITGTLTIGHVFNASADITSLAELKDLTTVGGELIIYKNMALSSFTGLDNVTAIGRGLALGYMPLITEIDGFGSLSEVGGSSVFYQMDGLTNIDGLSEVTKWESLHLSSCGALQNVDALSSVTTMASLSLHYNQSLTNINGLSGLTKLNGDLDISGNDALTTLQPLGNLTTIQQNLFIRGNDLLTNLGGLNKLKRVGRGVFIEGNLNLTNVDGLINLESIGLLAEEGGGLVSGDLKITGNDALTNLDGLQNLEQVAWEVYIESNNSLTDFCGLQLLATDSGHFFHIQFNAFNPSVFDIEDGLCSE